MGMMHGRIDHEFRDSRYIHEFFLAYLSDHYVGDTKIFRHEIIGVVM